MTAPAAGKVVETGARATKWGPGRHRRCFRGLAGLRYDGRQGEEEGRHRLGGQTIGKVGA